VADALACHFLRNCAFNFEVRLATLIAAVLEPLRAPPANFADAARLHFSHKRSELAAQALHWGEEAVLFCAFAAAVAGNALLARKLAQFMVPAQEVFAGGGCPAPRVTAASAGGAWAGPRTLRALAGELARVRALKAELFGGGAGAAAIAAASAAASAGAGAGASSSGSSSSSSSAAAAAAAAAAAGAFAFGSGAGGEEEDAREWQALRPLHAFWMAVSTLRAAEQVLRELVKLAPPAGLVGDGGVGAGELPASTEAGSARLFERLIASAGARREDVGGGWTSNGTYEAVLGEN
jgi:hypothetical protein